MVSAASNRNGFIGTILFHGAFLTVFLFFGLHPPYPPPPEEGIMVNFGLDERGSGESEPIVNDKEKPVIVPEEKVVPKEEAKILTQDAEDAPALDVKKNKVKKESPKVPEIKKETVVEKKVIPVKEEPKVNARALYTGRKTDSKNTAGEGVTGGQGNQGSPFGSVDSKNHAQGDSRGTGGPEFSLDGRNPQHLEEPKANYRENGDVVIDVTVDKDGKVTSARQGKNCTTQDGILITAAIKAAMDSKFDQKADAEPIQKGTITYHFTLK
jgi:outer membrane biosynthesis protein TonB